jgi:nitrite reductase/ring-hydroxylating ferredoxin subunit
MQAETNVSEWHADDKPAGTPYERAVLGFRNYWYPIAQSRQVSNRPLRRILLGDPIALFRRRGTVYATIDECPHRGARISVGKDEFPGTTTIACRFHGWVFDVAQGGMCVAALTDGPDSPVAGKIRLRIFPTEERKGIVWVWMGKGAPVPLEDDVPNLLLRDATIVKVRQAVVYGNWRYHAEGGLGNHAAMLHADAVGRLFRKQYAISGERKVGNVLVNDEDDGVYLASDQQSGRSGPREPQSMYPGLGSWPAQRPWRVVPQNFRRPVLGKVRAAGTRLPGFLRIPNFPMIGALYYEWYVAVDKDHYLYFQVSGHWPKNPISKLWTHLWYHLWAGPIHKGRFNNQDKGMIGAQTDFTRRYGANRPAKLYRPDVDPIDWIDMANRYARGEPGTEPLPTSAVRTDTPAEPPAGPPAGQAQARVS